MVITMAKLRMAHASTHGARKPPGPITMRLPELTVSEWARKCLSRKSHPAFVKRPKIMFFLRKRNKNYQKKDFFCIYLLVMPKYCRKQIFAHGRFPEVGKKERTEKEKKKRSNDGNNNGQSTHGAHMAHASRVGQFLRHKLESWNLSQADRLLIFYILSKRKIYGYISHW